VQELIGEASFVNKEFCVQMMTRPLATLTDAAPSRRKASAVAPMSCGSVFTGRPGMYSTMLGLSRTDFPRTFNLNSRSPS
jgi:hypothetical protein